ncbi:MAG TPA: (2Fe-2S)-binding protein [Candidatus Limnocylindria bacterium]|nr:(2Fe-2S)-binding protein [Candidatus Limnocylindria bacterium]
MNGRDVAAAAHPETRLLLVLRNDLGLVGTRYGCGTGHCGSCFVLLDGRPVASCQLALGTVAGRDVTTVEGLATGEAPHALQRAFVEEQAIQCGYCASGVLISAKALLDANPRPTDAEIRAALDGNLCRCGAQTRMVRAVRRAAAELAR